MPSKNLVLASYFNTNKDPQRNIYWDNDYSILLPLIESVTKHGIDIVIFHDCLVDLPDIPLCKWEYINPDITYVPSILRWFVYSSFLSTDTHEKVFMVDSTDVILLKNPFNSIQHKTLYVGSEYNNTWSHPYLKNKERYLKIEDYKDIKNQHTNNLLLNCGICGGYTDIIKDFLNQHIVYHTNTSKNITDVSLDMPIFNYTLRKHFNDILCTGDQVNTKFKEYEMDNIISWWKHK